MSTETLDIVDTAVKIGLGALISGFATYYMTKLNHANEAEKEFKKRRLNTIEKASENIDEYFNAFLEFISSVYSVRLKHPDSKKIPTDEAYDYVLKHDEHLVSARQQKRIAISRLRIIELNEVADLLDNSTNLENEFRTPVMFDRYLPACDELERVKLKINKIKEEFYGKTSKEYKA